MTNKEIQDLMDSATKEEIDEIRNVLMFARISGFPELGLQDLANYVVNRINKIWDEDELYE